MLDVVRIPSVSCAHREHISRCTALRLVSCARLVWIPAIKEQRNVCLRKQAGIRINAHMAFTASNAKECARLQ